MANPVLDNIQVFMHVSLIPGVLMARWKTCGTGGTSSTVSRGEVSGAACAAHVSRLAAAALVRAGAPKHCYNVLASLLPYWREKSNSECLFTRWIPYIAG